LLEGCKKLKSRRARLFRFLIVSAASILLICLAVSIWLRSPRVGSRLIFVGGTILTMSQPETVDAMYIKDGVIQLVGSEADVLTASGGESEIINLEGATVMPGLIETHTHPIATALTGQAVDVSGFSHNSRAEIMATLKEASESYAPLGWVTAFGWDPILIDDLDPPTLAELDAISPDRPLFILTQMMHEAYANSAVMEAAGITRDTPDPAGGELVRDSNGNLTGVIREVNAIKMIVDAMPTPPAGIPDLLVNLQLGKYAQHGITTVGVLGPVGRIEEPLESLRMLGSDRSAPVRLIVYALPDQIGPSETPNVSGRFRLRGVKFWMDGSPFAGGAAWAEPYENTPLVRERLNLGVDHMAELNYTQDDFQERFAEFHRRGFQLAVHVQGERAIDAVLDAVESTLKEHPRKDHRHRLEHNALITETQLQRARALGVTVSFFIDHIYFYGEKLPQLIGEKRLERYMPLRTAIDTGHRVTLHTDSPGSPLGLWRAMRTAILRTPRGTNVPIGAQQQLTIVEALHAVTSHASWQLGLEDEVGTLEVGKHADLVVLSHNPTTIPVERLTEIEVLSTWINGQPVDVRPFSEGNFHLAWQALTMSLGFD